MDTTRQPPRQYLSAEHVLGEMCRLGLRRVQDFASLQILVLAVLAGGFITMGALFSLLLSQGVEAGGPHLLLLGLGFSTGFFFVILSETVLFTEANVVLPSILLHGHRRRTVPLVIRFWLLAWLGNLLGAWLLGSLVHLAQPLSPGLLDGLGHLVEKKMHFRDVGTAGAWGRAVLSGVLANWLVGMAAFFATMGRTIFGKYIPVALAVILFVAANFQHSPANMGYFALAEAAGTGPGWVPAFLWNLLPAGLGNLAGGALLVAVPFWFALPSEDRTAVRDAAG